MTSVKKVMIIDDDEINNFICIKNIKTLNFAEDATYHLRAKEGLEELKNLAKQNPKELPNVIFLDINMPAMNGWDFLEEYSNFIQGLDHPIHLFILSSSIYRKDLDKAGNHEQVTDYIPKPLNKDKLQEIQKRYFTDKNLNGVK